MSWIPSFLSPLPAFIAAGIVAPALLVLYFLKLRRREVAVSSTLLWRKAIQDLQVNAPFQKLRRNLLLLLQMLFLLLLCLALARPVLNVTPGAGKMTVILIDRSASMNATDLGHGTRLDEAKRRAKELVGTLKRDSTAMVIAFDERAETVQPFTTDANALRSAIDSIQPTDRRTDLKQGYQLAEAQSNFNPEQLRTNVRPDVFVYSDGRIADSADLRITGNVKYDKIGTDTAKNIGVVALNAKRNYERPTEVQIFARLANYGEAPANADVELKVAVIDPANPSKLNFDVSRVARVSLPPDRWTDAERKASNFTTKDSVQFKIELTTGAVIRVEQKSKDDLAADDVAQVVIPPPKSLRVALVTDGNYFLERVLHSLNLKDPVTLLPPQYEAAFDSDKDNPAQYDVIIFDRYKPADPKYLPPAGNFIYFGDFLDNPAFKLKLKPVKDPAGESHAMMSDISVLDWNREHPILRTPSLNKLYVGSAMKLDVPLEADVLIEGDKGPLMVLYRESRRTHLVVTFDLLQSNWPLMVSFPVFMNNAMQYLALGSDMDIRQSYPPGATPRLPRVDLQKLDPNLKKLQLDGPLGTRSLDISPEGDFALPALDQIGVYTTDPPVPQYEQLAVNLLDSNESNLLPVSTPPALLGQTIERVAGQSRLDLWWWIIAVAAAPLLLIEWFIYTRRVHL